jgi:hypothetical protein
MIMLSKIVYFSTSFLVKIVSFYSCGPILKLSRTKKGPRTGLWETLLHVVSRSLAIDSAGKVPISPHFALLALFPF